MNKDVQAWIYGSSLVSIVAAIFLFMTGRRDTGIFVGLWAPTILAFGTFFNTETHRVHRAEKTSDWQTSD